MRKCLLQFICTFIVLSFIGCSSDADAYRQVSSEQAKYFSSAFSDIETSPPIEKNTPQKDLEGSLTIKTYWDENMDVYIQDFTVLHPNVSIELVSPGKDKILSFDDYRVQTSVELMSGNCADIIETDGLCVFKFAKTGTLCDLYPLMASDSDFHKEDYYTNIFEAKELEGKLYSLPCGFLYDMLYTSRPLSEQAGISLPNSLNYKQMLEIQKLVTEKTGETPKLMPGLTPYAFFYYEFPEYYSTNTQTASFFSPKFIEYLRLTKKNIPIWEENDLTRIGTDDSFLAKDYLFCRFDVSGGMDIYNFLYDFQNIKDPVPMVSTSGKAYFRTMLDYSIASSSPNRELAWEFLKYYVSEKEVPNALDSEYAEKYVKKYNNFVPINRNNFSNHCKFSYKYFLPYLSKDENIKWKPGDRDSMVDEAIQLMDSWNYRRNAEQAEGDIYGALCEDLNNYYYMDLLTAEETASKMQNRMTIFLKE